MAKTKFLSKVLAVLMALSMLCSTGVFADYDSGLTAGDAAVTGTITVTSTNLNSKIAFWGADTVEEAKWFDVTEGLNLKVSGTTDATTGTITYVVAPVGVLDQVPLDVATMEAQSVAIGTADIEDGEFTLEIEADAAKLVKDTTYELRLAYSKTEIADVTDASALVYQRYFKSFDWADAAEKATRTITKEGIGEITIDIEGNPIRSAAIDAVSTAAQYMREKQSVTHIRTADLKTGDPFHFSSSAAGDGMPTGFTWAGEEGDATRYTTTTTRRSMFTEVGTELRGGVVLAQGVAEPAKYFSAAQQSGNPAYRFKATQSGTVYVLGVGTTLANGWTLKDESKVSGYYNIGSRNYLYTSKEVTAADLGAETVELAALQEYIVANTDLAVTTPDAPGYYLGGSKSNLYKPTSVTYYAADTAYITPDGYFQAPAANLDENGEWILKADKPYNMSAITNYGYTNGRGWLTQERTFDHSYARTFEAGEWVEIPYTASVAENAKTCAVIQFDIPVAPLASATVTTAKSRFDIDALPMLDAAEVAFENGEYVIEVPRGTNTASFTVANANGAESEAVEVTMDAPSKVVKATIGDVEYDITVKFDDEYPSLYALDYGKQYGGANRITVQYGDLNTAATLKFTAKATNVTSGVPLSGVTFAGGAEKPAADKNLVVIGTPSANSGMSHMTTSTFGWLSQTTNNGTTFEVSAPATVYAKSVAFGNVAWPTIEALGWEVVGTFNGYNLYAKHFAAGETVQIPTQPITQAELDAKNATLNNGTMYAFITEENKDLITATSTKGAVGDVILWNHTDGTITSSKPIASGDNAGRSNFYVRPSAADTAFYALFDAPLALGEVTYSVDGGDADAITFAEGEFTKTIEVPYDATSVSVAATKTGTGEVAVSEALDLASAASGTVTVTLTAPGGTPVVYTINFVKGAPKILWESALALTGAAANPGSTVANAPVYSEGIYRLADQSGAIDLSATEVDLEVAYGTEAVVLNDEVTISLLDNNGEGTGTITINGTEYTVNVSWKAFDAAAMTEKSPLLYDLKYHGDAALVAGTYYSVVPTRLTLNADTDLEYGVGDVTNTMGTDDTADDKIPYKEGEWFYRDSHAAANLQATNAGAYLGRLHLAGESFASLVTTGDIDDKYALDGATLLVAHYKDTVANNAERYSFKSAVNGYVIVGSANANTALTSSDGWSKLEDARVVTSNITTSGNSTNYVFQGGTKQVVTWSTAFNDLRIKKVSVGDEVVVAESSVKGEVAPLVIVATEDMINERIAAPTVLESLSYTTALAVTEPKDSAGANGHSAASLHANGFYQPSLVTEAETVAVAADATTVTVTVPYGSEIVNLAGVDNYDGAVAFDAINLINNNGAATVTKTVGEVEYTINVKWADYVAASDAAGNHVYDVKYRIRDLADATYYNAIPTKISITENRIAPKDVIGYKDAAGAAVYAQAGEWYKTNDVAGAKSNLMTHNSGAQINRGRLTTIAFDGWVRKGLVTASGIPGAALPAEATDAEVDAIAYAAMNGATTLVAHYQDYASLATAAGANAAMAEHLSFKVAQDSIVYVSSSSSSIGEGWTRFDAGKLYLHNQNNKEIYVQGEGETYTKFANNFITHDYSAGGYAFYRYAKAGDTVSLTLNKAESNMPPVVLVRPIDFSGFEAPTMGAITYKIGSGEATPVEFAEGETTATIEVPWGTTDAISLQAAITSGQGNLAISDALTLSPETSEGAITVALTDVLGEAVGTYTVNFVWGAAPEVEAITYSTARTLYKGAVEKDAALTTDETEITVPWGTASVTVSYKMEGADAVALDAVSFVDGAASVDVPLPTGTVTYTFTYGAAPAGQYITGLTKVPNNWRDRMFVSYGDVDNAYTTGATKYATSGAVFFADDDEYSYRLPYGVAKKGYTAVIADAAANAAMEHMAHTSFPYMYGDYPATEASNAWMTFTVAKAGTIYVSPASRDEAWAEGEALGWTEAPFTMLWGNANRKVYQKRVTAGELVLLPNNKVTAEEVALYNETLTDVQYVQVTEEQAAAIEAAAIAIHGEGTNTNAVVAGDWIAMYTEEYLTANPDTVNYAGAKMVKVDGKEIEIMHYVRANNAVTFVVADEFVDDAARAPQYTGASTLAADGSIELSAIPAAYGEKTDAEITFALKEGAPSYVTLEGTTLTSTDRKAWTEGDSVTVVIAQGELTTEAQIAIVDVEENKYGTIEVYQAEGRGAVTAYLGDDPENVVLETAGTIDEAAGTIVTFSATPAEGYEFLYWALVDAEGKVTTAYDYAPEFKMNVGYGLRIKAVFATDNPEVYTVTFKGWQGNIISQFTMDTLGEAESFEAPQAPSVYGYIFEGYESADFADTYLAGDAIPTASIEKDVTFVAKYAADENLAEYTVTVTGGTVDGEASKTFAYNTPVTVIANEAEEGKKFSHWTEGEAIVSYDAEYDFYMASADRNLVAVYVDAEADVVPAPTVTMTVTEVDMEAANGPIYGLFAERRVPEAYTVVENGIVWGTATDDEDADLITLTKDGEHRRGASASKYQNNNGQYTVRLQMTESRQSKGNKWYARTYLTYRDTDGSVKTMYSAPALVWEKEAVAE